MTTSPPQVRDAQPRPADSGAAGGRARAAGFARRERPSLIVGGIAALYFAAVCVRLPWESDFALHVAVLGRLLADPLHPGDPVLAIGGSSAYYTPYTAALMLLGKVTGAAAPTLYAVAALANTGLLLTGLFRFVRTLSPARWAPPLALVGLLFWWGTTVIAWSGFLSLVSFADCIAYPSTFATAVTLHVWASLSRDPLRIGRAVWLGALLGAVALTHQFTSIGLLIGVLACLVARRSMFLNRAALRSLALGAAVCAAVIAAWPYYHLWDLTQGQVAALDPQHYALYHHAAAWYGFGVVGVVALALRARRDPTDPLVLLFLGAGAIVGYGALTQHWSYGRSWPMVMLAAQVGLAIAVAEARAPRSRVAWGVPVAAMTLAGGWTQSSALLYVTPTALQPGVRAVIETRQAVPSLPTLSWLKPRFEGLPAADDTVMADNATAQDMVVANGGYDVGSPWILPDFPLSAYNDGNAAVGAFFAPGTPAATRAGILARYRVSWILLSPGEQLPGGVAADLAGQDGLGFRLYRLDGPGAAG
jgi:hypothetical protein